MEAWLISSRRVSSFSSKKLTMVSKFVGNEIQNLARKLRGKFRVFTKFVNGHELQLFCERIPHFFIDPVFSEFDQGLDRQKHDFIFRRQVLGVVCLNVMTPRPIRIRRRLPLVR